MCRLALRVRIINDNVERMTHMQWLQMGYAAVNWGHAAVVWGWVQQLCAHQQLSSMSRLNSMRRFGPSARPRVLLLRTLHTALTPFCTARQLLRGCTAGDFLLCTLHARVRRQEANDTRRGWTSFQFFFPSSAMSNSGQRTGCAFVPINIRSKRLPGEFPHYLKWLLCKAVKKIPIVVAEMHTHQIFILKLSFLVRKRGEQNERERAKYFRRVWIFYKVLQTLYAIQATPKKGNYVKTNSLFTSSGARWSHLYSRILFCSSRRARLGYLGTSSARTRVDNSLSGRSSVKKERAKYIAERICSTAAINQRDGRDSDVANSGSLRVNKSSSNTSSSFFGSETRAWGNQSSKHAPGILPFCWWNIWCNHHWITVLLFDFNSEWFFPPVRWSNTRYYISSKKPTHLL